MNEVTVEAKLVELEARIRKLEAFIQMPTNADAAKNVRKLSPKEFLIGMAIKADTQKVLALSYYLERIEGMRSFNIGDLEAVFRLAKEKLPANMNDAVNKNIARGFLMEAEEKKESKKAWYLTASGERYVDDELKARAK